ncbi:uncharacterized protein LOC122264445 [Penaeus japonicus]|uniref:uncharacterized protein LOC122264445 n=1 Tax=Penaeus japonicus TaxID=27405 RepID=UPI001C70D982|nr:uncharacterized protein LOC122264445 [Penaeus japonicus]
MADVERKVMIAYQYVMTNEVGLNLNQPMTQMKKLDEANKIQILTIGHENTKPTKVILMIGQTGAGKTRLLNAMLNYILNVKFEDSFRYTLKDEIGTAPKSKAESQTEFVTGYLIYHQVGMPLDCNFLIIDTPGLGDTRGKEQQLRIRRQIEVFLTDETFEVSELHCLGFVVNGTINRSHGYLKEIVREFESLFGKDTIEITKVMATHTDEDTPAVSKVLDDINIKADKLYTFDNGVLYSNNRGGQRQMRLSQLRWEMLEGKYEEFFEDMLVAKPGSLRLCREAVKEKMNLERFLLMLKKHIDNKVKALLQCRNKKKLYEEYYSSMRCNEVFDGEETIVVKERIPINGRFTHAHNCPTCEQTCVYPCTTWKSAFCSCPSGSESCHFCPCSKNDHNSENETIKTRLEKKHVTNEEMKVKYDQAKRNMQNMEEMLGELEKETDYHSKQMAVYIKTIVSHIERINSIARNPNPKATEDYISEIIEGAKDVLYRDVTDASDRRYITELLDALPEQIDQIVLEVTNQKTSLRDRFKAMTNYAKHNLNPFGSNN